MIARNCSSRRAAMFVLLASATMFLVACSHPEIDRLKKGVVGTWADVKDPNAILQFSADGVLVMTSPREKHFCNYTFPDAKHLSIDCTPAGGVHHADIYTFELTDADDQIAIGAPGDVGHYRKQQ
jgi:hypothetical protein